MAFNIIQLRDKEDDCSIAVSVDSEHSGVLVYCTNNHGDKASLIVDAQLLKHLCNEVSKAITARAKNSNDCGDVSNATL